VRTIPRGLLIAATVLVSACGGERAAVVPVGTSGLVVPVTPGGSLVAVVPVVPATAPVASVPGPEPLPLVVAVAGPDPGPVAVVPVATVAAPVVGPVAGSGAATVAVVDPGPGHGELGELMRRGLIAPELRQLDPVYAGDLSPLVLPSGTTVEDWAKAPWSAVYRPLRLDCAVAGADARADPPPDGSLEPTAVVLAQSRGRRATMLATLPRARLPAPGLLTSCRTLGQLSALLGTAAPRETDAAEERRRSHASWSLYALAGDGRVSVLVVDAVVTRAPEDADWQVGELTVLGGDLVAMARASAPAPRSATAAQGPSATAVQGPSATAASGASATAAAGAADGVSATAAEIPPATAPAVAGPGGK
jgi:hypothetical protein